MTESVFPGSLVDAAWLAAHLENGDVRVIDIRGYVHTADLGNGQQHADYVAATEEYAAAHIPGSVFVDWTVDITDPESSIKVQLAPAARFAEAMSALGIDDRTDVVVVDHSGGHFATRMWWALKYFGHDRVAILDGGFNRWHALGLPLDATVARYQRRQFVARARPALRVDSEQVRATIDDDGTVILDARDPGQFSGAVRRGSRGGHIPSAINVWAKSFFADDGTWKSDEQLAEILAEAGVQPDAYVVAYCNGGVTATAALFALDRIGHQSWANYDGSWNEWGERLHLPVAVAAEAN